MVAVVAARALGPSVLAMTRERAIYKEPVIKRLSSATSPRSSASEI
ncbi:hypothetical protein ENSA5_35520 [Enhygromyxa salina]|uniref:Uncharacterized protein n=1 Tax=Enhygromyxa salina TaxID=215803 RepID=A0A2S9XV78_9BACT|nr:hypothetical protein ENSA5_35520 [Enhygromyxa salina]